MMREVTQAVSRSGSVFARLHGVKLAPELVVLFELRQGLTEDRRGTYNGTRLTRSRVLLERIVGIDIPINDVVRPAYVGKVSDGESLGRTGANAERSLQAAGSGCPAEKAGRRAQKASTIGVGAGIPAT
jgi:hypothetical protein